MEQYNATKNSGSHFKAKKVVIQSEADLVSTRRHVVIQSEADVVNAGVASAGKRLTCDWLTTERPDLCYDWLKHAVRLCEALGELQTCREKDQNVKNKVHLT